MKSGHGSSRAWRSPVWNWTSSCRGLADWQRQLQLHNQQVTYQAERRRGIHTQGFQDIAVRVVDNHGAPVSDCVLEFYLNEDKGLRDRRLTQRLQEQVITKVHAWPGDKSYRSLLINCSALYPLLSEAEDRLCISITASPEIHSGKVGYKTYIDAEIGALSLNAAQL